MRILANRSAQRILLLCILGGVLRLVHIGSRTPNFDESKSLVVAQQPARQVVPLLLSIEASPPLYFHLARLWAKPFADPLIGLRLLSWLLGVAALIAFWRLCSRLVPEAAEFALFLTAVSTWWVYVSQDARPYALFLLLAILQMIVVLDLRENWRWRQAALYALLGAAGLYTHYFFAFLLALHFLFFALDARGRLAAWTGLHGLLAIGFLPWLTATKGRLPQTASLSEALGVGNSLMILGNWAVDVGYLSVLAPSVFQGIGALCLLLIGVGLFLGVDRGLRICAGYLLGGFLMPKALEMVSGMALVQGRYLIFLSPFFYMALAQAARTLPARARWPAPVALGLLMSLSLAGWFYTGSLAPDLRRLSAFLRTGSDPREALVYPEPFYYLSMRYHFLPERRHYLIGSRRDIRWEGLPGYPAFLPPAELAALPSCLVLDFGRRLSQRPLWRASCADLAALSKT